MQLTTQLHLKVSGDAREELLARALPEGFAPLATSGELPFQIRARRSFAHSGSLGRAHRDDPGASCDGRRSLRTAIGRRRLGDRRNLELSHATIGCGSLQSRARQPIDPMQAGVPYRVARCAHLPAAARRGDCNRRAQSRLDREDSNRLSLAARPLVRLRSRQFRCGRSSCTGTMQQGWRLDMLAPLPIAQCAHRRRNDAHH